MKVIKHRVMIVMLITQKKGKADHPYILQYFSWQRLSLRPFQVE